MLDKFHRLHFWCQKVLPLVYDDSLSYYELLCKVVKQLNDHATALNTIIDFVNNFNSDVQEVVREMAENGELNDALKTAIFPLIADDYNDENEYNINDVVFHDDKLYQCTTPTTGEWDENDWQEITIADAISNIYNTLLNYVTYVTPEMFGAVGDGETDDTLAVQACFSSPIKLKMLCRNYKITQSLTTIDFAHITGNGTLSVYSTYGIKLDYRHFVTIDGIIITCYSDNIAGIYISTDEGRTDYCNIFNCVINAHQYGIYIKRTSHYCNEHKLNSVTIWGGDIGIFIENPDTNIECNDYTIEKCSAETVSTAFLKLKNVNRCVLRDCRIIEANGAKIITEETCNNLYIYSSTVYMTNMLFSSTTNGLIVGKARCDGIYDDTFGGFAKIVKGKIIAYQDWCDMTNNHSSNLNSSISSPSGTKFAADFFYSFNTTTEVTLTLSPDYYGGHGLINTVIISMSANTPKITVVNGDQTIELTNTTGKAIFYVLIFAYYSGNRRWKKAIFD